MATQDKMTGSPVIGSKVLVPTAAQKPASATNAVCTLNAPTNATGWHLRQVFGSYDTTPTVGFNCTIAWADSGSQSIVLYVKLAGPFSFVFDPPLIFPAGEVVTITLASGGTGIIGNVYASADQGAPL